MLARDDVTDIYVNQPGEIWVETLGGATERHYHKIAEELYFILEGAGEIELGVEHGTVRAGDAILIPAGVWHAIVATEPLRFLCCCAPPYSHEDTYFE